MGLRAPLSGQCRSPSRFCLPLRIFSKIPYSLIGVVNTIALHLQTKYCTFVRKAFLESTWPFRGRSAQWWDLKSFHPCSCRRTALLCILLRQREYNPTLCLKFFIKKEALFALHDFQYTSVPECSFNVSFLQVRNADLQSVHSS